jgi:hypothetical protein
LFSRHYVLTVSGQSGFVPKNYVAKEDISNNDFLKTLESVRYSDLYKGPVLIITFAKCAKSSEANLNPKNRDSHKLDY